MSLEPGVCGWEQAAAGHGQRGQAQPVRLQHHHAAKFRYVVLQKNIAPSDAGRCDRDGIFKGGLKQISRTKNWAFNRQLLESAFICCW